MRKINLLTMAVLAVSATGTWAASQAALEFKSNIWAGEETYTLSSLRGKAVAILFYEET